MKETRRIQEVDELRGIAAILMILGHSFIEYPVNISNVPWCAALHHMIYTFHMELFFLVAGVVYKCANYKNYIEKKVDRILIPYLFFGALTMFVKAFAGGAINGIEPLDSGFKKLIFYGGGYWFLYVSFLIFAIYPFIDKVMQTSLRRIILIIILLIINSYKFGTDFFMFRTVLHYTPYFIMGTLYHGNYKQDNRIWGMLAMCIYILLDSFEILCGVELNAFFDFVKAMAMICFLFVLVKGTQNFLKTNMILARVENIICDCGKYSLQLYLFNGYIMTVIRIIICNYLKINNSVVIVSTIWIGNLVVTLFICKQVFPHTKFLKKICGII